MSKNLNGEFRPKRVNFAQISNTALQAANLSLRAKGLYSLIQSLITLPDEDCLRIWKIRKKCKDGDTSFDGAWKELKEAGYLKQYRIPNGNRGQFKYVYDLLDQPDLSTPATINLNKDGEVIQPSESENDHPPQKGVGGQTEHSTPDAADSDDHPPHLAPYGKSTSCNEHPVLNGGDNSNTLSNNTLSNNTKSISQSGDDGQTDVMRKKLKEQIEYDYFEENDPQDITGIDAIVDCIADMLSRPVTKVSGAAQSRESLQSYINRVDSCTIKEFLEHMRSKNLSGVQNITGYWQSALINFLREQELLKLQV